MGKRSVEDAPLIMLVEDDEPVQSLVEDALGDGGFETALATSGEEAVTLLKGRMAQYRALVTDINLNHERLGSRETRQRNQSEFPGRLHDRRQCR